ncbi:MAG: PASTA domain-containing protein [Treponemataceae bacterium]
MGLGNFADSVSENWKVILITSLIMLFVVVAGAILVFFISLNPADQVMVPNIVGKDLNSAIIELQAKELNIRLQLRYSTSATDEGTVLEQNPSPGAIVKAGRKVEVVVSNGTIMSQIEDYVGKNVNEVKQDLQVLFTSGSRNLIVLNEPYNYKFDTAPSGTILSQDPPAGTDIVGRTVLTFVVSKGPENEMVAMPSLIGANLNKLYETMSNTKLLFNFSENITDTAENAKVVAQEKNEGESLKAYSRVDVKLEVPNTTKHLYGIYAIDLPAYPYAVDVVVDVINPNGERTQLLRCKHPGGSFTFPYGLSQGSILVLTVMGKEVQTTTLE